MSLVHPITENLRWKELQEERIIKAPVPAYKPLEDDGTVIVPAEQATEQCFRIYSVNVDIASHEVTAEALHINYLSDTTAELIVGTQVASANARTGNATFSELRDGQSILYWPPFAGTSSSATLELTMANGQTNGAVHHLFGWQSCCAHRERVTPADATLLLPVNHTCFDPSRCMP